MRNFLTGTEIDVAIVKIVPIVHSELAVVPIRVRDIASRIARTVILFAFVHITDNPHRDFLCCPGVKQA